MIKAILVEDEPYIRKGLISMIESLNKGIDIVGESSSVEGAVEIANKLKPDLVFLDINIVGGTGFDFIEQTKNLTYKVIFITAYEEFAIKALKNGAIDYVLKPVDITELEDAIDKSIEIAKKPEQIEVAKEHFSGNKEKLVLRLQDSFQVIYFEELKFCRSEGSYTYFYMVDGRKFLASKSIKEFESQLPTENFIRTHQSYILNVKFIDKYDKQGFAILKEGEKIPVSMRKKDAFITKLMS